LAEHVDFDASATRIDDALKYQVPDRRAFRVFSI
jgi:hypothetical protein